MHNQWVVGLSYVAAALVAAVVLLELLVAMLTMLVAAQRQRCVTADETGRTIAVPNPRIQGDDVKRLLNHPDIRDKSQAALRRLIRWWHEPCSDCHQEIMDHNATYEQLRPVTARILGQPVDHTRELVRKHLAAVLRQQHAHPRARSSMTLRSLIGPVASAFSYEYALGRTCPPEALPLLVQSTADVLTATAALNRRNMALRLRALAHVRDHLRDEGGRPDLFGADCHLPLDERAKYLLGVWIHTATAQLMRLTCTVVNCLVRHPRCLEIVKQQAGTSHPYMDAVLLEALRLAPGVVNTDRLVSEDATLREGLVLPRGTNVVIGLRAYHRTGFTRPDDFVPERWSDVDRKSANFIPFGAGKRRCPAERLSLMVAKELAVGLLLSLEIHVPRGVGVLFKARPHNLNNDLCCVVRRPSEGVAPLAAVLWVLGARLVLANIYRCLVQLATMPRNTRDALGGSRPGPPPCSTKER